MKNSRNSSSGKLPKPYLVLMMIDFYPGEGAQLQPHDPSTDKPAPNAAPARTSLNTSTIGGGIEAEINSKPTGVDTPQHGASSVDER